MNANATGKFAKDMKSVLAVNHRLDPKGPIFRSPQPRLYLIADVPSAPKKVWAVRCVEMMDEHIAVNAISGLWRVILDGLISMSCNEALAVSIAE